MIVIPSAGGSQQMVSLPIRKFPAFMLSIEPQRVKPEIRPKLELYQDECDQVLWDYWVHGHKNAEEPLRPSDLCAGEKATVEQLETIRSKIYVLPNRPPFMLDRDIAEVYGVKTERLNEQANRNPERFPEDFRFRLNQDEAAKCNLGKENLISQNARSSWGGARKLPWAYTREGCNMLPAVLKTPQAIERSILIIRSHKAGEMTPRRTWFATVG